VTARSAATGLAGQIDPSNQSLRSKPPTTVLDVEAFVLL